MNLPDAIEHLRRMRADSVEAAEKWRAINTVRGLTRFKNGLEESNAKDAHALTTAIEALGAFEVLLREGRPPIDTTKSAPPLTPEEGLGSWEKGDGSAGNFARQALVLSGSKLAE